MTVLRIMVCLLHLPSMINKVGACGGSSALKVVEMCKGGSTTARHFYLHGSPAGNVRRCDCNLNITSAASSGYFTPVPLNDTTATCGGTLTLPDGLTVDCTRTSRVDVFLYPGTGVFSFAYNTADVRYCLEVQFVSAEVNLETSCPGCQTTTPPVTILSSLPTVSFTYRYTSQTPTTTPSTRHVPRSTTRAPTSTVTTPSVSTTQTSTRTSTLSMASSTYEKSMETVAAERSMPVTGSLIAGWVTVAILVAVIVVMAVLLIRTKRASNYELGDTSQQSVSTQTDGGSIYEGLDRSNVTTPDTMYERLETQPTECGVKDYFNIEMGGYANP